MTHNSALVPAVNPDPRILTVLVIGTADNVRAYLLRQHTLGIAEVGLWSKPIPLPHQPAKVMCVLNRSLG